jgi:hypothetical protein
LVILILLPVVQVERIRAERSHVMKVNKVAMVRNAKVTFVRRWHS